jgi:hypothetical protein
MPFTVIVVVTGCEGKTCYQLGELTDIRYQLGELIDIVGQSSGLAALGGRTRCPHQL